MIAGTTEIIMYLLVQKCHVSYIDNILFISGSLAVRGSCIHKEDINVMFLGNPYNNHLFVYIIHYLGITRRVGPYIYSFCLTRGV